MTGKMCAQVMDQVFWKVCRIGDWEGVCIGDGSGGDELMLNVLRCQLTY